MVIVLTIICLIMYFVLHDQEDYKRTAIAEVIYCEIILYILTTLAVLSAFISMRDLKFLRKFIFYFIFFYFLVDFFFNSNFSLLGRINDLHSSTVTLDCNLLIICKYTQSL